MLADLSGVIGPRFPEMVFSPRRVGERPAVLRRPSEAPTALVKLTINLIQTPDKAKRLRPSRFRENFENLKNLAEGRVGASLKTVIRKDRLSDLHHFFDGERVQIESMRTAGYHDFPGHLDHAFGVD